MSDYCSHEYKVNKLSSNNAVFYVFLRNACMYVHIFQLSLRKTAKPLRKLF